FYTKIQNMAYRVCEKDNYIDILGIILGASVVDVPLLVSFSYHSKMTLVRDICKKIGLKAIFLKEEESVFVKKIPTFDRIRYLALPDVKDIIYQESAKNAKVIIRDKPLMNGRFELLYYYNEKSVSISYHRYGNLGIRGLENLKRNNDV
ncbi:MAG: 1-pyrroline-5-carboxylate dehydrogenase, partial [Helicobacter sp.]|nr:1-pyrroline-5-carboxylate dehydrogenase [Helicobacter sp.]